VVEQQINASIFGAKTIPLCQEIKQQIQDNIGESAQQTWHHKFFN
jgi:hypothetical protein